MKKQIKNKKLGFTLIELLVVISIIGLLSTITVTAVNQTRKKARDTKRYSDIATIRKALEMYRLDYGDYPDPGGVQNSEAPAFLNNLSEYLSKIPIDPVNSNEMKYVYSYLSSGFFNSICGEYKTSYYIGITDLETFPTSDRINENNLAPKCINDMMGGSYDYFVVAP